MKKLLLLGGSTQQIPAIVYAVNQGYDTVLCDYLPDNPGRHYANKYYCASTTDKEAIFQIAQKEKIDGIVAYASDPAAPTAAYVAEKLGLPTNPYKSVEILSLKDLFRRFLKENDFSCPKSEDFCQIEQARIAIDQFSFPVMVKPVDSSGSKGVTRVDSAAGLDGAFQTAISMSRSKKVIIEEFIQQSNRYMIAGDCFVLHGKVAFWGLLNSHRDTKCHPFVPIGTSYPIFLHDAQITEVHRTVQRMMDLLEIKFGAFNLELMYDQSGNLYPIELGPRNGGNMIPDLLQMITGVDLIGATVEAALGNQDLDLSYEPQPQYLAAYVLHTLKNGIFQRLEFDSKIEGQIVRKVIYAKPGDAVFSFDGANKAIGIVFLKFSSLQEMLTLMDHAEQWVNIVMG